MAHAAHRLAQEVGGTANGVGTALPQPGHQHVTGPGRHREQRVIAARTAVAGALGPLLGQTVGLAERRIEVDRERGVARSHPSRPGAGEQMTGHAVELANVSPGGSCARTCPGWAAP